MAKAGEEEVEYDSDPDEGKRLLGMRRREASSDDEEEAEEKRRVDRRAPIHSDDESDGQGGADYDDEEDDEEEDGLDEEDEVYVDEVYEEGAGGYEEEKVEGGEGGVVEGKEDEGRKPEEREEGGSQELNRVVDGHGHGEEEGGEEEKKENEPFAVPTAGAFYMHDDRFRENTGGRNRRTFGGRKLWESIDDQKWGHDKFEEMSSQDRPYGQGRRGGRGSYRGRGGRTRGVDRSYNRRSRPQPFSGDNRPSQNEAPKGVKGRGPRKYEHMIRNISQTPHVSNKQPIKAPEKTSNTYSGKVVQSTSYVEPDSAPPARKHSGLSYTSPPFYPSGSSNKDFSATQKRVLPGGNRSLPTPFVDENFSEPQSNVVMRGKNIAEGLDKLYIDDRTVNGKPCNSAQLPSSSSTLVNAMQPGRGQGRSSAISGPMAYQPISASNQVNRASATVQLQGTQRTAQSRIQPPVQASSLQFSQRTAGGSRPSSPPKRDLSISPYEPGDADTNSDSGKSRTALVAKGNGSIQGSGRGSFIYGEAQVVGATGNMGVSHGDQNFHTFLPVMQFGGQHPGGMGVPAVGMAFPGYVAQPQLGLGNSEMTWLPVLTGATGALGASGALAASYCSPYLAVDGNYHARPSAQTSSLGSSSKEGAVKKSNNNWKPTPRLENGNDDPGQRQKARRYSEMDFKQPSTST